MRLPTVLRGVVVLFAIGVGAVVFLNWSPSRRPAGAGAGAGAGSGLPGPAESPLPAEASPESGTEVSSYTDDIYVVESRNGRDVFAIWAEKQVDFVNGWHTWSGVRVVIFGKPGPDDDLEIRSENARTTGPEGSTRFNEVVFRDNVVATLPGGGQFTTHRIEYDAITGVVSNCNRNTLAYAGLQVIANCMEFQTSGEVTDAAVTADELRMWGDLQIRRPGQAPGGVSAGLEGAAEEMRFRPGGEVVYLVGDPQVDLEGASVRANAMVLDVGPDADELRGLVATGDARVRLEGAETAPGAADDSAGRTMHGEVVEVALEAEGGTVENVTITTSPGAALARLTLQGFGRLDAARLEVSPLVDRLTAHASGSVVWAPRGDSGPLRSLQAGDLRMNVAGDALESLEAAGGVDAILVGERDVERAFHGERLVLGWVNGVMQRGSWPEGIALDLDDRSLTAGRATLDAETGAWVLGGAEPPRVSAAEFDFSAREMQLHPDGELRASGGVEGTIGGAYLAAAAVLFGQSEAVQLKAQQARVSSTGALRLQLGVEVIWQNQSLVAREMLLEASPGRLRARGDVELVATAAAGGGLAVPELDIVVDGESEPAPEPEAGDAAGEAEFVTLTAADLLVEQATAEVRVAGDAQLRQGSRRIAAGTMVVAVDAAGEWTSVLAEDNILFEEDRARGTGTSLEYSMVTRDLLLAGDETTPARFVYEGVDPPAEYRSTEELRVSQRGDGIVIESTQDGRATTSVVPRGTQSAISR